DIKFVHPVYLRDRADILHRLIEQLERLAALGARWGFPAHGEPIEQPSRVLRATYAHRLMRERKVIDALQRVGPCDADTMLPIAYDDTAMTLWPLARLSLAAHLDKLVGEGRARSLPGQRFALIDASAQQGG
ncbi:MAG: hypothetical protein ACOC1F_11180, partial [Myxococcota bacterium]